MKTFGDFIEWLMKAMLGISAFLLFALVVFIATIVIIGLIQLIT